MNHDPDNYKGKYRIPSNRLRGFDYGSNAAYFVTICTHGKVNYLGEIPETQDFASQTIEQTTHNYTSQANGPQNKFGPQSRNLASVIRGYKSAVKKYATVNDLDMYWQERYHDRVIRTEKEYQNIAWYIYNNPLNWQLDEENQTDSKKKTL